MNNDRLINEAKRCFQCKNPRCVNSCPINTPIPQIIKLFEENKIEEAGEILFNNNPLSVICSIVCPHEKQCIGNCIRGIKDEPVDFPKIEFFISDLYLKNIKFDNPNKLNKKVAIVGSGPSGITLAFILAQKGYDITIFEEKSSIGGVLRYGIPSFRLSRDILDIIEEKLISLDVKIRYNTLIGPVISIDKLLEDNYDAVFIGTGLWSPKPLNIKGETKGNVYYAIDYLKSPRSYNLGEKVIVIGAGNVAMDTARTAKYYGAKEVTVVYRRGFEDMTATQTEINHCIDEGVKFELFKSPVEILDEGVVFIDTKKLDNNLVNIEGTNKLIKADSILIAVSQIPKNDILSNAKDLEVDKDGLLITDELGNTTKKGVFASGDIVTGPKTVVLAVSNTKIVANTIDDYLKKLL